MNPLVLAIIIFGKNPQDFFYRGSCEVDMDDRKFIFVLILISGK